MLLFKQGLCCPGAVKPWTPVQFAPSSFRSLNSGFLPFQTPGLPRRLQPGARGQVVRRPGPFLLAFPFQESCVQPRHFCSVLSTLLEQGGQKRECSGADRAVTWEPLAIS